MKPKQPQPTQYLALSLSAAFTEGIVEVCMQMCVPVHQGKPCYELRSRC